MGIRDGRAGGEGRVKEGRGRTERGNGSGPDQIREEIDAPVHVYHNWPHCRTMLIANMQKYLSQYNTNSKMHKNGNNNRYHICHNYAIRK